jgi:hypothetical protein
MACAVDMPISSILAATRIFLCVVESHMCKGPWPGTLLSAEIHVMDSIHRQCFFEWAI